MTKKIIPYNEQIPYDKIQNIASWIRSQKRKNIERIVITNFKELFRGALKFGKFSYSIQTEKLFDVDDAIIIVSFNKEPLNKKVGSGLEGFEGISRVMFIEGKNSLMEIPIIYMMPDYSAKTYNHEIIHICQFIHDELYPMSSAERVLFLSAGNYLLAVDEVLRKINFRTAVEFSITSSFYCMWSEMEANYYSRESDDFRELMTDSYGSARPILKLIYIWDKGNISETQKNLIMDRFYGYFDMLEREVSWIKTILKYNKETRLSDLIATTFERLSGLPLLSMRRAGSK